MKLLREQIRKEIKRLHEELGMRKYPLPTEIKATLEKDHDEVVDAIGDMVVVLTNLAHLNNVNIETCIASAYNEIKNRKGKMNNGTFVKDE